ncbi:MAG: hypothetical protein AAF799_01105 [Myxococcota bacterium]
MNTVIDQPSDHDRWPANEWRPPPGALPMRWATPQQLRSVEPVAPSRVDTSPALTVVPRTRANTAPFVPAPPPADVPQPGGPGLEPTEADARVTGADARPPLAIACMLLVTFVMLLASLSLAVSAVVP